MISVVILLFSLAIMLGLYLIYIGVRQHRSSPVLALTHASMASLGLVLLMVGIFQDPVTRKLYNIAAFVFVMALFGGMVLLALREGRKPPAVFLVMLHALMALPAFILLIMGYLQY